MMKRFFTCVCITLLVTEKSAFVGFLENDNWREIMFLVVRDFILFSVNWKPLESANLYEKHVVDLFEIQNITPAFFSTRGKNTIKIFLKMTV